MPVPALPAYGPDTDALDFVDEVSTVVAALGSTDQEAVRMVLPQIKVAGVKKCVLQYLEKHPGASFKSVCDELVQQYGPPDRAQYYKSKLQSTKQGKQPLDQYFNEIEKLCYKADPQMGRTAQVRYLKQGLNPTLLSAIVGRQFKDPKELKTALKQAELDLEQIGRNKPSALFVAEGVTSERTEQDPQVSRLLATMQADRDSFKQQITALEQRISQAPALSPAVHQQSGHNSKHRNKRQRQQGDFNLQQFAPQQQMQQLYAPAPTLAPTPVYQPTVQYAPAPVVHCTHGPSQCTHQHQPVVDFQFQQGHNRPPHQPYPTPAQQKAPQQAQGQPNNTQLQNSRRPPGQCPRCGEMHWVWECHLPCENCQLTGHSFGQCLKECPQCKGYGHRHRTCKSTEPRVPERAWKRQSQPNQQAPAPQPTQQ